jgi:glycine/D-amino acid oxidase-like deaminating enzyme
VTRTGGILVASRHATLAAMGAQAARFAVPHQRLDRAGLEARSPMLAGLPALGAVSFPDDGVIDVHGLLQGYLAASRAAGVEVVTGAEVIALRAAGAAMEVVTRARTLLAERVVIAAGAWAGAMGDLVGAAAPPFATLRRHLFVSARDPRVDARAPWVWHVDEGFYMRPESTAWLLSACDEEPHPPGAPSVAPDALEHFAERATTLAPGLHGLTIARSWACLRTFAPDRRPFIGWDREVPALFWVAGLGGHGATASAAIGALAADGIVEGRTTRRWFA